MLRGDEALREPVACWHHLTSDVRVTIIQRTEDSRSFTSTFRKPSKPGAIYQAVNKAYCASHELHMKLHYESCGHGVGRPSGERAGLTDPTDQALVPPSRPDA
jgi:hypothetical protein